VSPKARCAPSNDRGERALRQCWLERWLEDAGTGTFLAFLRCTL
jgi:hypothetical protein